MSRHLGYVLSDSASELDRLRMQARFWEPDAETMLGLIGVPGDPYRRLPVQFAASLKQRILDEGLIEEGELGNLMLAAEVAAADDQTLATPFTLMQAWGPKAA